MKDRNEPDEEEGEEEAREGDGSLLPGGRRESGLRPPSKGDMLIYGGFLLNVSTKGTIACFETVGALYAMTNFSLSRAEVREAGRQAGVLNGWLPYLAVWSLEAHAEASFETEQGAANDPNLYSRIGIAAVRENHTFHHARTPSHGIPEILHHLNIPQRPVHPRSVTHSRLLGRLHLRHLPAGRSAWSPCFQCGSCADTTTTSSSSWGACRS